MGPPATAPKIQEDTMTAELSPIDKAKFVAAKRAVDFIEDGMKVGLGTGSTAAWMVRCLGERVRQEGLKITGVPTSTRPSSACERNRIGKTQKNTIHQQTANNTSAAVIVILAPILPNSR